MAPRVLREAAGMAGVAHARLTVMISDSHTHDAEAYLQSVIAKTLPAGMPYLEAPRIRVARVTQGRPADGILEFAREGVDLLVAGTRARTGLSRWLLGSTSSALLEQACCPTLLIPPGDLDIVTLSPQDVRLNVGTVLAAVDLTEHNQRQLAVASELAELAGQPLVLMTVADAGLTDADVSCALLERGADVGPTPVRRVVVRRGPVPDEIAHAAVEEASSLVVMGIRTGNRGMPGDIATAVLRTRDALVLAVPAS
jgi:nucleotide-binding universal stress UspA family protein